MPGGNAKAPDKTLTRAPSPGGETQRRQRSMSGGFRSLCRDWNVDLSCFGARIRDSDAGNKNFEGHAELVAELVNCGAAKLKAANDDNYA